MPKHPHRFLIICFGLAFVVFLPPRAAEAARTPHVPDFSDSSADQERATTDEIERAKLVNVTAPDPALLRPARAQDYFYHYRNSLSVRAGVDVALNALDNPGPILGLLYHFPQKDLRALEAGADLNRNGEGVLHLASRTTEGRETFRWFYKIGAGIRIVASEQLVTIARLKNWQVRLSGGFEWTLSGPASLRADLDLVGTSERVGLLSTLGIAFAW